ncbi:MAG: hypothetical protein KDC05_06680 [Bacteroidales bacterium]|nr:hypothetical protein [Bacteroidales bacterium]
MKLAFIALSVFLINIPFGYWRANVSKFSWQWILAIHIPVLIIVLERIISHLGFAWVTYPLFIVAFFVGQMAGVRIHHYLKEKKHIEVSSCIFVDCFRNCF